MLLNRFSLIGKPDQMNDYSLISACGAIMSKKVEIAVLKWIQRFTSHRKNDYISILEQIDQSWYFLTVEWDKLIDRNGRPVGISLVAEIPKFTLKAPKIIQLFKNWTKVSQIHKFKENMTENLIFDETVEADALPEPADLCRHILELLSVHHSTVDCWKNMQGIIDLLKLEYFERIVFFPNSVYRDIEPGNGLILNYTSQSLRPPTEDIAELMLSLKPEFLLSCDLNTLLGMQAPLKLIKIAMNSEYILPDSEPELKWLMKNNPDHKVFLSRLNPQQLQMAVDNQWIDEVDLSDSERFNLSESVDNLKGSEPILIGFNEEQSRTTTEALTSDKEQFHFHQKDIKLPPDEVTDNLMLEIENRLLENTLFSHIIPPLTLEGLIWLHKSARNPLSAIILSPLIQPYYEKKCFPGLWLLNYAHLLDRRCLLTQIVLYFSNHTFSMHVSDISIHLINQGEFTIQESEWLLSLLNYSLTEPPPLPNWSEEEFKTLLPLCSRQHMLQYLVHDAIVANDILPPAIKVAWLNSPEFSTQETQFLETLLTSGISNINELSIWSVSELILLYPLLNSDLILQNILNRKELEEGEDIFFEKLIQDPHFDSVKPPSITLTQFILRPSWIRKLSAQNGWNNWVKNIFREYDREIQVFMDLYQQYGELKDD